MQGLCCGKKRRLQLQETRLSEGGTLSRVPREVAEEAAEIFKSLGIFGDDVVFWRTNGDDGMLKHPRFGPLIDRIRKLNKGLAGSSAAGDLISAVHHLMGDPMNLDAQPMRIDVEYVTAFDGDNIVVATEKYNRKKNIDNVKNIIDGVTAHMLTGPNPEKHGAIIPGQKIGQDADGQYIIPEYDDEGLPKRTVSLDEIRHFHSKGGAIEIHVEDGMWDPAVDPHRIRVETDQLQQFKKNDEKVLELIQNLPDGPQKKNIARALSRVGLELLGPVGTVLAIHEIGQAIEQGEYYDATDLAAEELIVGGGSALIEGTIGTAPAAIVAVPTMITLNLTGSGAFLAAVYYNGLQQQIYDTKDFLNTTPGLTTLTFNSEDYPRIIELIEKERNKTITERESIKLEAVLSQIFPGINYEYLSYDQLIKEVRILQESAPTKGSYP